MKYGDPALWSAHASEGTCDRDAWQGGFRTYELQTPLTAIRLDTIGSRRQPATPRAWYAIGAMSVPAHEYVARYAVLNPAVVASVTGGGRVALDRWILPVGAVVNVGVAARQSPFATARDYVELPGGAVQLELVRGVAFFLHREFVSRLVEA